MSWHNLAEDVTDLFSGLSQRQEWTTEFAMNPHHRYYYTVRVLPVVRAAENAQVRMRRRLRRRERMLARGPCPVCAREVKRDSKRGTAKIPVYCGARCAGLARQRAYRARVKAEFGVTRRPKGARL